MLLKTNIYHLSITFFILSICVVKIDGQEEEQKRAMEFRIGHFSINWFDSKIQIKTFIEPYKGSGKKIRMKVQDKQMVILIDPEDKKLTSKGCDNIVYAIIMHDWKIKFCTNHQLNENGLCWIETADKKKRKIMLI